MDGQAQGGVAIIPFIDISSHQQGPLGIDWPAVAQYLLNLHPEVGVIVKATEGTDYVNPYLHQQRMGAHAAGIKNVGLYHYGRPSKASGSAEADYFMKAVGDDGGVLSGEFYCFDIEDTDVPAQADLDAYVLDFAGRVSRPFGRPIVLYSGKWYADPHNLDHDPKLAELGLWWASVGSLIPPTPEPWKSAGKSLLLWQYDWHGRIPGIQGDCDLDYLVGGIETLRPYQWSYNPPTPGPINPPPDTGVDPKSENVQDAAKIFRKISEDALALSKGLTDPQQKTLALTIKADSDQGQIILWGH